MSDTHNTQFDRVEGKVFFVEEPFWKAHRIVDAKLGKLEIALDVNDNDKVNLVNQMKRVNSFFYECYFYQLLFISRIVIQSARPCTISFGSFSGKFYYCFLLLVIIPP